MRAVGVYAHEGHPPIDHELRQDARHDRFSNAALFATHQMNSAHERLFPPQGARGQEEEASEEDIRAETGDTDAEPAANVSCVFQVDVETDCIAQVDAHSRIGEESVTNS